MHEEVKISSSLPRFQVKIMQSRAEFLLPSGSVAQRAASLSYSSSGLVQSWPWATVSLSEEWVLYAFSRFLSPPQNILVSILLLGESEWECVRTWSAAKGWIPIWGVFPLYTRRSWDRLWIHHDPNHDSELTDDKWATFHVLCLAKIPVHT